MATVIESLTKTPLCPAYIYVYIIYYIIIYTNCLVSAFYSNLNLKTIQSGTVLDKIQFCAISPVTHTPKPPSLNSSRLPPKSCKGISKETAHGIGGPFWSQNALSNLMERNTQDTAISSIVSKDSRLTATESFYSFLASLPTWIKTSLLLLEAATMPLMTSWRQPVDKMSEQTKRFVDWNSFMSFFF